MAPEIIADFETRWRDQGRHPAFMDVIALAKQGASTERLAEAYRVASAAELAALRLGPAVR